MSRIEDQYDAYPYPERDPADEKKRLIVGSPSHPVEIDHFVFGGKRDWTKPFRALVAGGGTGDALMQMAQISTAVDSLVRPDRMLPQRSGDRAAAVTSHVEASSSRW